MQNSIKQLELGLIECSQLACMLSLSVRAWGISLLGYSAEHKHKASKVM